MFYKKYAILVLERNPLFFPQLGRTKTNLTPSGLVFFWRAFMNVKRKDMDKMRNYLMKSKKKKGKAIDKKVAYGPKSGSKRG